MTCCCCDHSWRCGARVSPFLKHNGRTPIGKLTPGSRNSPKKKDVTLAACPFRHLKGYPPSPLSCICSSVSLCHLFSHLSPHTPLIFSAIFPSLFFLIYHILIYCSLEQLSRVREYCYCILLHIVSYLEFESIKLFTPMLLLKQSDYGVRGGRGMWVCDQY